MNIYECISLGRERFIINHEPSAMSQRGFSPLHSGRNNCQSKIQHSLARGVAGFTLIELAMVLVVLGLLISLGVGLIGPLTKRAKLIETRETVKTAYESILGYAAKNKSLPPNLSVLGVKTTDAYNRPLFYNAINVTNFCTSAATYLTVNDSSSGTLQTKTNVAFIIFGDGENRCGQTGTASPFAISVTGAVVACPQDANAEYDDIVMYVDIDKLRSQICSAFKITTESLPIGTEEMAYPLTTLGATDGTLSYTWSISSGSLPPGLTLLSGGIISGTPTTDGSYNFTMRVTDSDTPNNRIATKSLTITVNPNKPRITTEFLSYGTVGTAYPSTTLSATGGKASYTWSLQSGSLPPGLSLSGGSISGTPTTAGTYSFTVRVTDSGSPQRTHDKTLSIAINPVSAGGGTGGTGGGGTGGGSGGNKLTILNNDYEGSDYKINDGDCKSWSPRDSTTLSAGEKISVYWQDGGIYKGKCSSFI